MHKLIAALAALLLLAAPAAALETGSAGWTTAPMTMFQGPGAHYDVVGEIGREVKIRVDRCSELWCLVRGDGQKGWVSKQYVTFGQEPRGPLTGPRLDYPAGGPGRVCLHEGRGYTGQAICGASGFVARDLLLYHADNRFSSISVEGNVSAMLCRDRDFKSYCERVIVSQDRLQGFLDNGVTSFRVY